MNVNEGGQTLNYSHVILYFSVDSTTAMYVDDDRIYIVFS